jgi:hypothetical protein
VEFINRNSFDVRTAVCEYRHPTAALSFTMIPMVHVATRGFYDRVRQLVDECDVIFVEGIRSARSHLLTRAYRWMASKHDLGLVLQSEALPDIDLQNKAIYPDMPGHTFDTKWSGLPFTTRMFIACVVPFYAIYLRLFATRELIAQHLQVDQLTQRDEALDLDEHAEAVMELILDERDSLLCTALHKYFTDNHDRPIAAAVVYGAGHMIAVAVLLRQLGYRVQKSEWVIVFELDAA